jgi:tellurite resistance protein TerC
MFVFISIFNYFKVPYEYQRRVLLYGVLSAIVMRLIIIVMGVYLVKKFHWILYLFGILLIYTGIKMLVSANQKFDLGKNRILNFLLKHFRFTKEYYCEKFFVKLTDGFYATPLFLVLIFIEACDLIFSLDSIPAIFGITEDPFIIFSSNIFAILGLRSLYFLLANMNTLFYYLKHGVALILIFIGIKLLIAYWFKMTIFYALGIIILILISSIIISVIKKS